MVNYQGFDWNVFGELNLSKAKEKRTWDIACRVLETSKGHRETYVHWNTWRLEKSFGALRRESLPKA